MCLVGLDNIVDCNLVLERCQVIRLSLLSNSTCFCCPKFHFIFRRETGDFWLGSHLSAPASVKLLYSFLKWRKMNFRNMFPLSIFSPPAKVKVASTCIAKRDTLILNNTAIFVRLHAKPINIAFYDNKHIIHKAIFVYCSFPFNKRPWPELLQNLILGNFLKLF